MECYRFLTHDCGAYLASYQSMTIWHMRDIISKNRRRIQESDVKVLQELRSSARGDGDALGAAAFAEACSS